MISYFKWKYEYICDKRTFILEKVGGGICFCAADGKITKKCRKPLHSD